MPWHPPCALSNLIVTNLSSCQRIDFSIFDSFFLLRPTAKLSHFTALRALFLTHSQLVSLQDVFPSGCAVFKVHQVSLSFRSPIPENDTSSRRTDCQSDHSAFRFVDFSPLRLFSSFELHRLYLLSLSFVCIELVSSFRISASLAP